MNPKESLTQELSLVEQQTKKIIDYSMEYIPKIIVGLIILIIGLWVIKRIAVLASKAMEKRNMDVSLRTFFRSLIGIGLKIILIITVAGMIGIQTTSFVTILGAAGLAIGLALQGSLSNFAGGVLVLMFKPFKVGDVIEVMGQKGVVREIQIFNTILTTPENRTVILPNGSVSNGVIINQSKEGTLRSAFDINFLDNHPVSQVRQIILEILKKDERILQHPAPPSVICTRIMNQTVTVQVRFHTLESNSVLVMDSIMEEVVKAFKENNITQPTPEPTRG